MNQVFLSYAQQDERDAAFICERLREKGLDVFWHWEIPPAANWAAAMGRALEKCDSMVVVVSPEAMDSDLVQLELGYAIFNLKFKGRVFPAIIRPTQNLPQYFDMLYQVDLTKNRAKGIKQLAEAIKKARSRPTRLVVRRKIQRQVPQR